LSLKRQRGDLSEELTEVGHRDPSRVTNPRVSPGQRKRLQPCGSPETSKVGDQPFPAPDRSIQSEACPVQGHTDDRFGLPEIHQAGGDMGVVMLDFEKREKVFL
jgi:hypothetical protein